MKPVFLTCILLGTILLTGCSMRPVSVKPVSWSGNITASGQIASGSWNMTQMKGLWTALSSAVSSGTAVLSSDYGRPSGTGVALTAPEPKRCVTVFEHSAPDEKGLEYILRRVEISTMRDCGAPKRESITKDSFLVLDNWEKMTMSDEKSTESLSMYDSIAHVNEQSMDSTYDKILKKEKIRKNSDGEDGLIVARATLGIWAGTDVNISLLSQNSVKAGKFVFMLRAIVPERKWESTYTEMRQILSNGFRELPGIKGKDIFDWKSAKTDSSKFSANAITLSDMNGLMRSVPVKVTSSKDLSRICGPVCRNGLSGICQMPGSICSVESVSSRKVRWSYSLIEPAESSEYEFETDVLTGTTKLVKSDRECYEDGSRLDRIPCK